MPGASFTLGINSNPANGASQISADGSTFNVNFSPAFSIPADAKNPRIELRQFYGTFNFPNVPSLISGNTITVASTAIASAVYTFPTGLYSLSALSTALNTLLVAAGFPTGTVVLTGDVPTGTVFITATPLPAATVTVAFAATGSVAPLLGFNAGTTFTTAAGVVTSFQSPNVATFDHLQSLIIQSDLGGGFIFNGRSYNAIASIPIGNTPPGGIIQYEPPGFPLTIPLAALRGAERQSMRFTLSDQDGHPQNTVGSFWNALFAISWE